MKLPMIKQATCSIMIQHHTNPDVALIRATSDELDDRTARWSGRAREPRSREQGLTVVEMLVATMIVALGVVGASSVFVLSARSTAAAGTRSDAATVLASEIEAIRALPYEAIGIGPSQPGYEAIVDGRTTVTTGTAAVEPTGSVDVGGQVFEIDRAVTWVVVGTEREAYKLVRVTVNWRDAAGDHDVSAQTGIYGNDDG